LGQGIRPAAPDEDRESETVLVAASAVRIRRDQYRSDRVRSFDVQREKREQHRTDRGMAERSEIDRRRMGVDAGIFRRSSSVSERL
jgi:hypothetical protein